MEIQHIVSGFTPKLSSAPSSQIKKQLFSLKFTLLSSSYRSIQSQNCEVPSGAFLDSALQKGTAEYGVAVAVILQIQARSLR